MLPRVLIETVRSVCPAGPAITLNTHANKQTNKQKTKSESDIYSFAVILWESYTQRIPWSEKQIPVQIVMAVGIEKKRLPVPPTMPRGLKTILRDSWRHDPRLRPSFKDLLSKLQIMLKKQHPISERTDDGSSGTDNEMTSSSS